jgi:hypothetical protein
MIKPADAQAIPKPSTPEFTLKYVDHSYYEQPTYSTDPYTGEQITVNNGGFRKNDSIEITIKNQPFTSHVDENGKSMQLYYGIRLKGHSEIEWREVPKPTSYGYVEATSFGYSTITISLVTNGLQAVSPGGRIDFQVQALIGKDNRIPVLMPGGESYYYQFTGETSGWSPTQTITVGNESVSPSPSPTIPELSWLAIVPLLLSMLIVVLVIRYRKIVHG